ncbi:adenylate/guanylate cyclase domain-containing protein [Mycobacterium sp. NAZ190054]|uniref:ATP-binding protein n=1 Tax=Mycobacterium sp. NAZ190054 TaxID=1747766 RepID=UPI00079652D1|nr:adenylate/guanylate cyclase domain-containing protein [Mycobacterium sp. NAZ190054]KWX57738.1 adenylyl cyclase [Mycobacterium sp. NAZ190054]
MASPVSDSTACCGSCGNDLRAKSRFCDLCGAPVHNRRIDGEHKQVTVLFADVVGSMKLAAELDAERLREIMDDLFNRCAAVVQRYQGTLDKFTGDGLMALFGAPMALEDHALRACIAGLEIQSVARQMAGDLHRRDGVVLQLRVGLNTGDVIVGEIGSGPRSYTAVGHAVGMAQRMESAAHAGTVLCSLSTAALVGRSVRLGRIVHVDVKGAERPVPGRRALAVEPERMVIGRNEGLLLGRAAELAELHRALDSRSSRVVAVIGAPGVGKSRLVDEFGTQAAHRGVDVVVARCDAHATPVAFRALSRFLRAMFAVEGLSGEVARHRVAAAAHLEGVGSTDAQILFEAMGVADPSSPPLQVGVDGWRHRLVEIVTQALRARLRPTVFILEDAHWADPASDAVLAECTAALPGTAAVFVTTYRPEFHGNLHRAADLAVALQPLDDATATDLARNLLGRDMSTTALAARVARVAGGNPFFVEEIIRDLAGRGVLAGGRGHYRLVGDPADIGVPATVHAVLAARIDRLPADAKSVLNAAAVIGSRFDADALATLVTGPVATQLAELVATELIDQTEFVPRQRYCFRHTLVRTVAYDSQLSATRVQAHRRLAAAIESRDPAAVDENAALIASHLESAGVFAEACRWHLRAADWLRPRDLLAARAQWESALRVADQLPDDQEGVLALRIAPRAMLISTELFTGTDAENDDRFTELRELVLHTGDLRPLALAMAGRVMAFIVNSSRVPEAMPIAAELTEVVDHLVDEPASELEILLTAMAFARWANCEFDATLEITARSLALRLDRPSVDRAVAHAIGGLTEVFRGHHRQGIEMLCRATELAREMPPVLFSAVLLYWGILAATGLHVADDLVDEMSDALERAESFGDRFGIIAAQWTLGTLLLSTDPSRRGEAVGLLDRARTGILTHKIQGFAMAVIEPGLALEWARQGRREEAIEMLRGRVALHRRDAALFHYPGPAEALCELLIARGRPGDLQEADDLLDFWAAHTPGTAPMDLWTLRVRALLAAAHGLPQDHRTLADSYLAACEAIPAGGRLGEARRMAAAASG